ncbi:MAG: hypothetical protein CYG60_15635 [Actinobacteria bacterium]|jgi:DNA-binding IclR family transcriptional regulator|nr:MAG: hypothetical protein CYG60_15635 [Actinomycetota bacterium]
MVRGGTEGFLRREPRATWQSEARRLGMERAFDVIEALSQRPSGLTPVKIARDVGLEEAAVRRLLSTLQAHGAVERDRRTQTYKLGRRLIGYVSSYFANVAVGAADGFRALRGLG